MAIATLSDTVVDELVAICGEDHVFTGASALYNRARVPAPFPAHKWEDHTPQAVVLPTSAAQISEVVKLANRHRIPVVPRAGGTGLTDGAVPLRHGILVDVKLMNEIHERLPDAKVGLWSGSADLSIIEASAHLAAEFVLVKGIPSSELMGIVNAVLGRSPIIQESCSR